TRLARRHRLRLATHGLDRTERGGSESVACEGGEQEREGAADEKREMQALESISALPERLAHDDHDAPTRGLDGRCEQPGRLVRRRHASTPNDDRGGRRTRDLGPREEWVVEPDRPPDERTVRVEDLSEAVSPHREASIASV